MLIRLFLAASRQNRGRVLLALAGIALGVALGVAVHTINASAIAEMTQATRMLAGSADLRVEAGRTGFDESVYPIVARHRAVAAASPVVETELVPLGHSRPLRVLGIDPLRAVLVQPQLIGKPGRKREDAHAQALTVLQPDSLFLNRAAMQLYHPALGDKLTFASGAARIDLAVAGDIDPGETDMPLAVMDIAGAQSAFGREGNLSRIDIRVRPGVPLEEARRALASVLPAGVELATPEQGADRASMVSRAYRVNLTVLALVALFTGAFLVFSTSALAVVRRREELALLRVIGVTRRELAGALIAEGALIGVIGSCAGSVIGIAIANGVLSHFGSDLGSGYFTGLAPRISVDLPALVGFVLIGTLTGAAGALLPALEAARRPPALALRRGDEHASFSRLPRTHFGIAIIMGGVALAFAPPVGELPLPGYAAIGLILVGTIALMPGLTRWLLHTLPEPQSTPLLLAWQQVRGMPGYAAAGLAAVVVSFSLVAAMAIMVNSFRESFDHWLSSVLAADLYVRAASGGANKIDAATLQVLTRLPGVRRMDLLRYQSLLLDSAKPPVTLIARPVDETILNALSVRQRIALPSGSDVPMIWVSEAMLDIYGMKPGDRVTLPIAGRREAFLVAGVWRDYARSFGAVVIGRDDYIRLTGDSAASDVGIWLSRGQELAGAKTFILDHVPGAQQLELAEADEIHRLSLHVFDRSFAVTYALEFVALLVGLAGISSHFAALGFARRREFGVLRHLGLRRRDIASMLVAEGSAIGALGALLGLLLGFAVSLILVYVVNRQSFHWGMELHPPWISLAVLALVLVLLAGLAALISSRFAMTRAAVFAVKEDS